MRPVLAAHDAQLIEDAAQAHGTISAGKLAGTTGIAGCFSTHDRKLLATGEGGFILTSNPGLHKAVETFTRLDHLRGNAAAVNFKLAAPLAAIGLARLPGLDEQIRERTANARILLEAARGTTLAEPRYESGGIPNYYSLVLLASGDPAPAVAAFTAAGLPPDSARWGYRPLHQRPLLADYAEPCQHAHNLARRALHLPVHPGLTRQQVESMPSPPASEAPDDPPFHRHRDRLASRHGPAHRACEARMVDAARGSLVKSAVGNESVGD